MNGSNAVPGTAGQVLEPSCVPVGPAAIAGAAAEAMEKVSRLTMMPLSKDTVEWEQPSDLSRLVGELRCLVGALPQVLEQLARCLEVSNLEVILSVDGGTADSVDCLVATAAVALEAGVEDALHLGRSLADSHNAVSHLYFEPARRQAS